MVKVKYGYRNHCGGLRESLSTKRYIDENDFKARLKNYSYYAYDPRCRQFMFIRNDMEHHIHEPTWLFIEIEIL